MVRQLESRTDQTPSQVHPASCKRFGLFAATVSACCLIGITLASLSRRSQREITLVAPTPTPVSYPSLADLQAKDAATLAQQDIALLNLACADALPGAEPIDIDASLRTLDQWVE